MPPLDGVLLLAAAVAAPPSSILASDAPDSPNPLQTFPDRALGMRRSIDDYPFDPADYPPQYEEDELTPISWGVAISDDYDDAEPRVVLTVEEVGRPGQGLVGHLNPTIARRLRLALRDGLRELGEDPGG